MPERGPNTPQDAGNCIAKLSATGARSAGTFCRRHGRTIPRENDGSYKIGQKFGGDTHKAVKRYTSPFNRFEISQGKVLKLQPQRHKR